jgi:release factor glutamine methyltransferase
MAKAGACKPNTYSLQSHARITPMVNKPMMSESECRKRLAWQNKVHEEMKAKKRMSTTILCRKIIVPQNVFLPLSWDSNLLAKTVLAEVKTGDKVLDMGTGSGIQAIFAASKSTDVIAADVNPFAVRCAKLNVKLNKLSTRVKVMESDSFAKVNG